MCASRSQVDGRTQTFAEVGALLRRRGVDLDNNRFLILQGEVRVYVLVQLLNAARSLPFHSCRAQVEQIAKMKSHMQGWVLSLARTGR